MEWKVKTGWSLIHRYTFESSNSLRQCSSIYRWYLKLKKEISGFNLWQPLVSRLCPTSIPPPLCGTLSLWLSQVWLCRPQSGFHDYFCTVIHKLTYCCRWMKFKYECEKLNGRISLGSVMLNKHVYREHKFKHCAILCWRFRVSVDLKHAAKEFIFWYEVVLHIWIKCILGPTEFHVTCRKSWSTMDCLFSAIVVFGL